MISAVVYDADGATAYADIERARAATGTTWVRASNADADELAAVADVFGIHPLSVEDVRRGVRPKSEDYPAHLFVLAKTATLRGGETAFRDEILTRPVGLFVGSDWLVTMSTHAPEPVERTWDAVGRGDERLLRSGPDFAAYRILDGIVDGYFDLLDEIERTIEEVEDGILDGPDPDVLRSLNAVRRDLLSVRKLLWPTREAIVPLARGDPDEIREPTEKYYRDVGDHLVQLVDLTETYRDLASGARDIYLNTLSQSTNEVMKRLTVVATIILPLSFVVGVYGMNFGEGAYNMPELRWTFGYPAVMIGMAAVAVILLTYFRNEGWL
ncbi:magnesium/cobalt transporter CorA [Halegenticoccus tardaugens]|uniref:magnesium/cobalt transporter CorA n=1 Tax=Halegenticoccus tardaugens TaxID=2071624 RepID=UPI00100B2F79|nr:magnesium/cobalt transporter CorA [Halegenticoccus tardaugens]